MSSSVLAKKIRIQVVDYLYNGGCELRDDEKKELEALIDQKLSGVTGGIALISAHIDDIFAEQVVAKPQSLALIKKAADELWESLKIDNVPETK